MRPLSGLARAIVIALCLVSIAQAKKKKGGHHKGTYSSAAKASKSAKAKKGAESAADSGAAAPASSSANTGAEASASEGSTATADGGVGSASALASPSETSASGPATASAAAAESGLVASGSAPSSSNASSAAAEHAAAPDAAEAASAAPAPLAAAAPVPVRGKWNPVFYGFLEFDSIHDSTQSFAELAGNGAIARAETYPGSHARMTLSARHSRLGFKLTSPETHGVRASGNVEFDFLGNQPANPPGISEAAFFTNPTPRMRHFMLKVESEYLDLLVGQYWQLFGWQSYFHPNSVNIQGLPGQVFGRAPQLRLSHRFEQPHVKVELAVAAARPPQRDAELPDFQGGVRVLLDDRKGLRTAGATGMSADALGFGLSGAVRRFALPELSAAPVARKTATGWGLSADVFVPIVPATLEQRGNALTLTASYAAGSGIADLYTGLTGGIAAPAYPPAANGTALAAPVDPGLVAFAADGSLHTIDWRSFMIGLQYYFPSQGQVWVSANYSHMSSRNIASFAAPASVFDRSDFADGNLFWDLTQAVRFGASYAFFGQTRGDGAKEHNHRIQVSSYYLF